MLTSDFRKTFVVLLVLAIALLTASFVTRSATAPAADRSYDSIERVRALPDDPSGYEQIEALRSQRGVSLPGADSSDYLVERVRMMRSYTVDYSYDAIEAVRLER